MMNKRNYFGQKTLLFLSLFLTIVSAWEAAVRLDAMYKPVKMFFDMAIGERIPLSAAMNYFDWTIFEAPVWLAGCIAIGLLSLLLSRRKGGQIITLILCAIAALYGLTRQGTFLTDLWRLLQPALLFAIAALSLFNLSISARRKKRNFSPANEVIPALRMEDAPRLRRSNRRHSA